jgi:hypothetical protein
MEVLFSSTQSAKTSIITSKKTQIDQDKVYADERVIPAEVINWGIRQDAANPIQGIFSKNYSYERRRI